MEKEFAPKGSQDHVALPCGTSVRKYFIILEFTVLFLFVLIFFVQNIWPSNIDSHNVAVRNDPLHSGEVRIGSTTLSVEIPQTTEQKEKGLSGRSLLESNKGMFFIFDTPDRYGFWMPDMYFPIDIVWINSDLRIVDIAREVFPASYPKVFYPNTEALYVLEVRAGLAEELGWTVGMPIAFHVNQ